MSEPRLTEADREAWAAWERTFQVHAQTKRFLRRVDATRATIRQTLTGSERPMVGFSGGKDSMVLAHLVHAEGHPGLTLVSHKDDLDFPGEVDVVRATAAAWGASLRLVHPPVSPSAWMDKNAHTLLSHSDLHSHGSPLSREVFYGLMDEVNRDYDLIFLGLRAEESYARRINRRVRGLAYEKENGQRICQPIADWTGQDVFAYLVSRGLPILPIYKCCAFMHRDAPWLIREAWWLPGTHGAQGKIAWLRHYYPSLYQRLCGWFPDASLLA